MLPEFLSGPPGWGALSAIVVFSALLLTALVVNLVLGAVIKARRARDPNGLSTLLLAPLRAPVVLLIVILGAFLGFTTFIRVLDPAQNALTGWGVHAGTVFQVVIILVATYLIAQLLQAIFRWYTLQLTGKARTSLENKLAPTIRRVIPAVIYPIGLLVVLDTLGIPINPMLAGLGIGGLAVALALSPTIASYIAGTYSVTEGQIKEGDYIELDKGPAGFVVDVGWRSTTIRSRFNNLVIIPNRQLSDSIVTNFSTPTPAVTSFVECGVSYDSDLEHVERVALEVAKTVVDESESAVKDFEVRVRFDEFADSNINFRLLFQGKDRTSAIAMKSLLMKRLHRRFKEEGIEINYPMRKLVFPEANGRAPKAIAQAGNSREVGAESSSDGGMLTTENGTESGRAATT
jgi:small-conductance mechanosensitive channel